MKQAPLMILAALLRVLAAAGCGGDAYYVTEARKELGLVMVLHGAAGKDFASRDVRKGLDAAGVQCAIRVRTWGLRGEAVAFGAGDGNGDGRVNGADLALWQQDGDP